MKKQIVDSQGKPRTHLGKSIVHIKNKISDTCYGCLWECVCDGALPCPDYSPVDEGDYIDDYIETRRIEFSQDWKQYLNE